LCAGEVSGVREALARRIAGEIVLSRNPGATMRKWREIFGVSQTRLSKEMGLSPSVLSDYESGRRRSPGIGFVRRYVTALLKIDDERGGHLIRQMGETGSLYSEAIIDMREFPAPITIGEFCKAISAELVACKDRVGRAIYGYTVINSVKAIYTLSGWEFFRIFGLTTERALIFTGVRYGRSPMVAVRISMLKPGMVVMHGAPPDRLAVKLAEVDRVPLAYSKISTVEELVEKLRELHKRLELE